MPRLIATCLDGVKKEIKAMRMEGRRYEDGELTHSVTEGSEIVMVVWDFLFFFFNF